MNTLLTIATILLTTIICWGNFGEKKTCSKEEKTHRQKVKEFKESLKAETIHYEEVQ